MNILDILAPLGAWTAAADPNSNVFGEGIGCDIVDAAGFPVCEISAEPILHNWHIKFPGMPHWADGASDGRTQVERTPEQIDAIVRLIAAAPRLLAELKRIADGQVMTGTFTHAETVSAYQRIAREATSGLVD